MVAYGPSSAEMTAFKSSSRHTSTDSCWAPSTASRRHEIRLDRANLPGIGKRVRTVVRPREGIAIEQSIAIPDSRQTIAPGSLIPEKGDDSTRVVSWNIEYGGILKRSKQVRSVLKTLRPDILLLQEIENDQSIGEIKRFLDSINEGQDWTLSVNRNTGNLRSRRCDQTSGHPCRGIRGCRSIG